MGQLVTPPPEGGHAAAEGSAEKAAEDAPEQAADDAPKEEEAASAVLSGGGELKMRGSAS